MAGPEYRRALVVALDSLRRHNPSFCRSIVVLCPPAEVAEVQAALAFLADVKVIAQSRGFERVLEELELGVGWAVDRFRSLELLVIPHPSDEAVLLLDADTLTRGPLDELEQSGDVVACGEGARHLGLAVDRTTNAICPPATDATTIARTFNSGVMKLSGAQVGPELLGRAVETMRGTVWPRLTRRQHDQFVLNRMFEGDWVEASPRNNFLLRHAATFWARTGVSVGDARHAAVLTLVFAPLRASGQPAGETTSVGLGRCACLRRAQPRCVPPGADRRRGVAAEEPEPEQMCGEDAAREAGDLGVPPAHQLGTGDAPSVRSAPASA